MRYPIGYMGIGEILDAAVEVFKNHFVLLLSIAGATTVPIHLTIGFLMDALAPGVRSGDQQVLQADPMLYFGALGVSSILFVVLTPLASAATIYGVASVYLSRPTSLGDCLKHGLRCWLGLVGTTILMVLAVYGGTLLCLIPGIIFALWFMVFQHVVVLERFTGPTALGRSKDLMQGELLKGGALYLLIFVINISLGGASLLIPQPQAQLIVQTLVGAVLGNFVSCAFTMMYFSCRSKHDNFDLQMLVESAEQA